MSIWSKIKNLVSKLIPGGHSHPQSPAKIADKEYGTAGEKLTVGPGTSKEAIVTQWIGISQTGREEILAHEDFSNIPQEDKNYLINYKKPEHKLKKTDREEIAKRLGF